MNLQQLGTTWDYVSSQIKINKVYIETFRSMRRMPEEQIEPLKKFFTDRGVRVAGGMTLTFFPSILPSNASASEVPASPRATSQCAASGLRGFWLRPRV